jgi:hypothetical protein
MSLLGREGLPRREGKGTANARAPVPGWLPHGVASPRRSGLQPSAPYPLWLPLQVSERFFLVFLKLFWVGPLIFRSELD